jgi:predicted phage terminase large subunit-like protein
MADSPAGAGGEPWPDRWRRLPVAEKRLLLDRLRDHAGTWTTHARPEQLPPGGDWYLWLVVGGRGSGKTRAGAEWLASELAGDQAGDASAVLAPTFRDARDTCVEGPSGLIGALERRGIRPRWNRTDGELRLPSGAVVWLDGADDAALRIQGKNLRRAWCDELGLWRSPGGERAWDESLLPAVRVGQPRIAVTTTPKATVLVRRLLKDPEAVVARMSTFDNQANLAPEFLAQMRARYDGTRLGRQELDGLLVEDVEGALWRQQWLDDARRAETPHGGWQRGPVMGVDPADGTAHGAEHAYTIAALGMDHELYVLESVGLRSTPYEFARQAIQAAARHNARMMIEKNHGGAWLVEVVERALRDLGLRVPYQVVSAAEGKRTRAEPVAALYEQGRVHHLDVFVELEQQMTAWTGATGERSPDRLDSLVWALSEFTKHPLAAGPPDNACAVPWDDNPRLPGAAVPYEDATDWHHIGPSEPAYDDARPPGRHDPWG